MAGGRGVSEAPEHSGQADTEFYQIYSRKSQEKE